MSETARLQKLLNLVAWVITQLNYDVRFHNIRDEIGRGALINRPEMINAVMMCKVLNAAALFNLIN